MDERVLLLTGRTVNSKDTQRLRKAQYEAAMAWRDQAPSDTALYNFERMNDRPSNAFRKILPYVPEARDALDRMDIRIDTKESLSASEYEKKEEGVRDYYRRVLSAIEMQPQPFYRFSARGATDRIFSSNPSFLLLPGGIRNILCQEFVVADLSSAGLAICAKLWNCEQTLSFLRDGGDVWEELCSYLGASPGLYGKVKDGIKGPLHATEYGLCAPGVKGMVTKAVGGLLGKQAGQRFGRHWMLQELFEARDRELKILRDRGYGVGPGGETVPIPEDGDENSVMATIVQRWEQKLMQPVLELEERHHAGGKAYWRVMYWLHDAVALHFTRSRGKYLRAIQEMVEARAATYGIPTRLMVAS